uniref:GUN4-like domain-containing protein n=1 Tax=Pleurostichidium falkenbergii TaxID=121064 RepID=A0A4D6UVV4_9FLOR|nr:hypothetical protein [Pleurostichidium falkenbergii]QCH39577.1 hypothetical protein [Pleurostichidium falkenbergii]
MKKEKDKIKCTEEQINTIFTRKYLTISNEIEEIIDQIIVNEKGKNLILDRITRRAQMRESDLQIIDGLIYQKIVEKNDSEIQKKLKEKLPNGIINLEKCSDINYQELQNLLINKNFEEADKLTQEYLRDIVKLKTNSSKNWLYFTDIQFIPKKDLFILDLLWKIYSKGKFGYSIQKKIWIKNNKKWDHLWKKIYWTKHGVMKRYPNEFTWTIDAPEGHLPLFNQLRGTQTLLYLFLSIDW